MRTISRWPCATRRRISPSTASARRLRVPPRTSGITQKLQEKLQPSWIFTNARTRSRRASSCTQPSVPTSAATAAGVSSLRRRTTTTFSRQARELVAVEVRRAAGDEDAAVRARRARGRLPRLRERLVRDAAGVDDRDVRFAGALHVPVGEQALAHLLRIEVGDLAAEEADIERRHVGGTLLRTLEHVSCPAVADAPLAPPIRTEARLVAVEIAGRDDEAARRSGSAAHRRARGRCSPRRRRRPAARRVTRSSCRTSSVTPFAAALRSRRVERGRVDVDGDDRRESEQRRGDRDDARAAADVDERGRLLLGHELDAELRRRVRAGAERLPGIDDERHRVPRRKLPRRADPERADLHGPVELAPALLPAGLDLLDDARPGGGSASVYAASSSSRPQSRSSKPSGKRSTQSARASSARSSGTRTAMRLSEMRSSASRRSLRPARTSRRSTGVRTPRAGDAARRSAGAGPPR